MLSHPHDEEGNYDFIVDHVTGKFRCDQDGLNRLLHARQVKIKSLADARCIIAAFRDFNWPHYEVSKCQLIDANTRQLSSRVYKSDRKSAGNSKQSIKLVAHIDNDQKILYVGREVYGGLKMVPRDEHHEVRDVDVQRLVQCSDDLTQIGWGAMAKILPLTAIVDSRSQSSLFSEVERHLKGEFSVDAKKGPQRLLRALFCNCRRSESNRYGELTPLDFESSASAIPPLRLSCSYYRVSSENVKPFPVTCF
jgi:hypothetical protein